MLHWNPRIATRRTGHCRVIGLPKADSTGGLVDYDEVLGEEPPADDIRNWRSASGSRRGRSDDDGVAKSSTPDVDDRHFELPGSILVPHCIVPDLRIGKLYATPGVNRVAA